MARKMEQVGDRIVNGDGTLKMSRRLEPFHDELSSPRRLMGVFRPVIQSLVSTMFAAHAHIASRCAIRVELIGDKNARRSSLFANELTQ